MKRIRRPAPGFSLVELAIVLFVVSLLIGGLLMPLSAQYEIRGRQETDKALANIREALIGFAVVNGRLPCPAVAGIPTGTTVSGLAAGREATTPAGANGPCACETSAASGIAGNVGTGAVACDDDTPGGVTGVLPWVTLGVPEADAWGNRFTYRITTRFGRLATGQTLFGACTPATNPANAAFALCSSGDMAVLTAVAGNTIAGGLPAVIVSHGKNGFGAYRTDGSLIAGATANEAENANGDVNFVSSIEIDDLVAWIPPGVLMGRMLASGRLP